jgi:hypothetical protein
MMAIPPHHALKETGIHFSTIASLPFLGGAGLFLHLLETEVCQKTTEVPSGSVATIAEDTGAADSHRNLRGNVQRYGGVQRMLKRGDVEQSAASHRLELRIVKFTNHDDFLQRGCM